MKKTLLLLAILAPLTSFQTRAAELSPIRPERKVLLVTRTGDVLEYSPGFGIVVREPGRTWINARSTTTTTTTRTRYSRGDGKTVVEPRPASSSRRYWIDDAATLTDELDYRD